MNLKLNNSLQLGVLDFGFITPGKTALDVIEETLQAASLVDSLGYSRYWLTEHHGKSFAWNSPEIMLSLIARKTSRIRLGTAGILLYFYNSLKIAEIFRVLEVLYPQRIDLGLAAGLAEDETMQALSQGFDFKKAIAQNCYDKKVGDLLNFLQDSFSLDNITIKAPPAIDAIPQMWLLGTGKRNMQIAAARGTAFSYSIYHSCSKCDPDILQEYRDKFQPSVVSSKPQCSLAVGVICAETEIEARMQKKLVEKIDKTTQILVFGTPEQCWEQLLEMQHRYGVNEIAIVSSWHIFQKRKLAYQMLGSYLSNI